MSKAIISKICSQCKEFKPLSEFYKNKQCKDGYRSCCKICRLKQVKKYSQTEKGKACRRRYKQSEKGKVAQKRYNQSEKDKAASRRGEIHTRTCYPERIKARSAVSSAIATGKLIMPKYLPCYYCPDQAEEYHHHKGYAKAHWLDIVPTCIECHINLPR